jgi:molybdate transport system substrate-binding protein
MLICRRFMLAAALVTATVSCGGTNAVGQDKSLTVFAAASLKNAIDETNAAFLKRTGIKVVVSYAATSALVKQIAAGAPADVFLSADLRWMDYATEHKLIRPETRVNLLGNTLVLIAPKTSKLAPVTIREGFDIAALAGPGRIAVANVESVPAGRYAKAALQSLGAWSGAEKKLAMAENVRAALAFVARGETPIGVVYATDARAEPNVKVIGTFPDGSHPPIIYPLAATAAARKPEATKYLDFLRSREAKAIFQRHGFTFLGQPSS